LRFLIRQPARAAYRPRQDTKSKFTVLFPKRARKLLLKNRVAVFFGSWMSDSRKSVLPIFEENNGLLPYAS
jgi:hypothetical protein